MSLGEGWLGPGQGSLPASPGAIGSEHLLHPRGAQCGFLTSQLGRHWRLCAFKTLLHASKVRPQQAFKAEGQVALGWQTETVALLVQPWPLFWLLLAQRMEVAGACSMGSSSKRQSVGWEADIYYLGRQRWPVFTWHRRRLPVYLLHPHQDTVDVCTPLAGLPQPPSVPLPVVLLLGQD